MIAKRLGIAKSIVSTAISNKYGVSDALRSKILITAHEMGYDFSRNKRYRVHAHKKISLVIPDNLMLEQIYWKDIISGIIFEASKHSIVIDIYAHKKTDSVESLMLKMRESPSFAIIFIKDFSDETIRHFYSFDVPIIAVDSSYFVSSQCNQITANNYDCGFFCAKYLIERGHKTLCFLGNTKYSHSFLQRYQGFSAYIDDQDGAECVSVIGGGLEVENYADFKQFCKVFKNGDDFPTAIFCANDDIAKRAIDHLNKIGLRVPDDVSIIGFDNVVYSQENGISTFDVPRFDIGIKTVEKSLFRQRNQSAIPEKIEIACFFIERNSVKNRNGTERTGGLI
jgi:LacI family transcriptional regulator